MKKEKFDRFQLMCVVFNKKNMHAFDKQTRKLLSAVDYFLNFISVTSLLDIILLSSIVLHLLTSPTSSLMF